MNITYNSPTSVTISWTNNEPNPYNLYLDRATDTAFTQNVASEVLSQGTTSFTDTLVVPNTEYYYRVRTVNVSGTTNSATLQAFILPSGIASSQAIGTPKLTNILLPSGLSSAQAFGHPVLSEAIFPTGIPSAGAFGRPTVTKTISPSGIPSSSGFGSPAVTPLINPVGIASAQAFGNPTVAPPPPPHGGNTSPALIIRDGSAPFFEPILTEL
jgi:hypothetical protein